MWVTLLVVAITVAVLAALVVTAHRFRRRESDTSGDGGDPVFFLSRGPDRQDDDAVGDGGSDSGSGAGGSGDGGGGGGD